MACEVSNIADNNKIILDLDLPLGKIKEGEGPGGGEGISSTYTMHNTISVLAMISKRADTTTAATAMPTIAPVGRTLVDAAVGVVRFVGVAWVVVVAGSRTSTLETGNPASMYAIIEFCMLM